MGIGRGFRWLEVSYRKLYYGYIVGEGYFLRIKDLFLDLLNWGVSGGAGRGV